MVSAQQTTNPINEENQQILDILVNQKLSLVRDMIREFNEANDTNLAYSGTRAALRERLSNYLADGDLTQEVVAEWLLRIEGWGDQYVYLYDVPSSHAEGWETEEAARNKLKDMDEDYRPVFNNPIFRVPQNSEIVLSHIAWSPDRIRFVWVQGHRTTQRVEEFDREVDDSNVVLWKGQTHEIEYKAYIIFNERRIIAFDWDLFAGKAMLQIRSLTNTHYPSLREKFEDKLAFLNIRHFEKIRVSQAITTIKRLSDVRSKSLSSLTESGNTISYNAAFSDDDLMDDPQILRADRALSAEIEGSYGDFYWDADANELSEEVHTKFYANADDDQRIYILRQHKESDLRSVLSRIRNIIDREA